MDRRLPSGGVPAVRVRLASRLQMATFFGTDSTSSSSNHSGGRQQAGPRSRRQPPALTVDVRIVIRRHFPVAGPGGRIAEKVAEDIALRRRPSRKFRRPESVDRALAEEVLPLVAHPFDRVAVVASRKQICANVAAACADPRVARGGARVLVLIDTFACPVVLRRIIPLPPKLMKAGDVACVPKNFVVTRVKPCMEELESDARPIPKKKPVGVIGDRRPEPVAEERYKGWVPW